MRMTKGPLFTMLIRIGFSYATQHEATDNILRHIYVIYLGKSDEHPHFIHKANSLRIPMVDWNIFVHLKLLLIYLLWLISVDEFPSPKNLYTSGTMIDWIHPRVNLPVSERLGHCCGILSKCWDMFSLYFFCALAAYFDKIYTFSFVKWLSQIIDVSAERSIIISESTSFSKALLSSAVWPWRLLNMSCCYYF